MIKKLLFIGLVALSSCEKETCNCGTITDDKIFTTGNGLEYTLSIRNSCSDNVKTFYFDEQTWLEASVGENFCVTNEKSW